MRLAVIADVHSNKHALASVLENIDGAGMDTLLCAGDIVGYGAFPNDCCKILAPRSDHSVLGNHDMSSLTGDASGMNPYASAAVRWTHGRLTHESKYFLRSLRFSDRFSVGGFKVAMFHGSPRSPTEYIYEEQLTRAMVESTRSNLLILGHTHVPFVAHVGSTTVLNPGSVGQPRDGDPRASYAIVDTETRDCRIARVDYPIGDAAEAIVLSGLPRLLADRLELGR